MTAKNQTVVSGNEEFEQPFGLIHGERLTIGSPEGLLADKGNTLLLQLVFRGTNTSGFGRGEDGGRHDVETNAILLTYDMVHGTYSLHLGSVGEHLTTIDIADGVEIRGVRSEECGVRYDLIVLVNRDGTVGGESYTCSSEIQALCTGLAPRCHQDDIGLNAFRLSFLRLEEHLTISNLLDTTLHIERDALLFHQLAQTFGNIAVECREALLQELDDRHL